MVSDKSSYATFDDRSAEHFSTLSEFTSDATYVYAKKKKKRKICTKRVKVGIGIGVAIFFVVAVAVVVVLYRLLKSNSANNANHEPWTPLVPPSQIQQCVYFNATTSNNVPARPFSTYVSYSEIGLCWQKSTQFVEYELQRDDWWNEKPFYTIYKGTDLSFNVSSYIVPASTYNFR